MVELMSDDLVDDLGELSTLSPDQLLYLRLRDVINGFSERQSEILRLAEFMDERAAEIDNAKRRARQLISAQLNGVDEIDEEVINDLISLFERMGEDDEDLSEDGLTDDERQAARWAALDEVYDALPEGHTQTYVSSVLRALHAPPGADVLRSSLLVSLVGELEVLVNNAARAGIERQPAALDDSGRTWTWAEIARHESIEDIRDAVVDRAIEDVLRGSLKEWLAYFIKRFHIAEIPAAKDFRAQEAIQRRHCVVHNGGLASSQYLDRLSDFKPTVQVGDSLAVDGEYLRRAADTLHLVAFSLVWSLAFKLTRDDEVVEDFATLFSNRTYYLLQEGRYDLIKQIGRSAPVSKIDEDSALVIQVNYWLAHKLSGTFDEVKTEVQALKVGAMSRRFNLAKHALLDEHEEAHRVAQSMIRDGELRPEFLFTWPLLSGVRGWMRKKSEEEGVADGRADH